MSVLLKSAVATAAARRSDPPARIQSSSITPGSVFDPALWPFQGIIVTDITRLPVRFNRLITGATLLRSALSKRTFERSRGVIDPTGPTPKQIIDDPFGVARRFSVGGIQPARTKVTVGIGSTERIVRGPRPGVGGMSLQIKAAKLQRGIQPSIFGGIGRFLGGVARTVGGIAPGPVGGILRGLGGLLAPRAPPPSKADLFVRPPITRMGFQQVPPSFPRGVPLPGRGPVFERMIPGGETGLGLGCPVGFHPNKSGHWTSQGFVPKGSICVRNRRRNPLNPRALDRAMSRITSAKKASQKLSRITIRKKC